MASSDPIDAGNPSSHETIQLLNRARRREGGALDELLIHVWPRIEAWIRRERNADVASRFDTMDCAQDVALGLIQYLPNIVVRDVSSFHRILYKMIQNSLLNKGDYLMARRRQMTREKPLDEQIVLNLEPTDGGMESPSVQASKAEEQAWIRLALALLDPKEQELILRRHYDGESFDDLAKMTCSTPGATRMRFNRALASLFSLVRKLQQGQVATLVS